MVNKFYTGENILTPNISLSHPINKKAPVAKKKPASHWPEHDKTLDYESMAIVNEIPSISNVIEGSRIYLCIVGVKGYNVDNHYYKKGKTGISNYSSASKTLHAQTAVFEPIGTKVTSG